MISGDIVLLNFPFSDMSGAKLRPVIVLAMVDRDEFVACQITSKRKIDPYATELAQAAFAEGGLRLTSFARPGKLFTAHRMIVVKRVGRLQNSVLRSIRDAAIEIIRKG